jgi:hypothetical protein
MSMVKFYKIFVLLLNQQWNIYLTTKVKGMKAKPKTCQLSEFYIKLFDIVINLIFNIVLFHMLIDYLYSD